MRLWHKGLIPVLPRQQLLGQWRELCAISDDEFAKVRRTCERVLP